MHSVHYNPLFSYDFALFAHLRPGRVSSFAQVTSVIITDIFRGRLRIIELRAQVCHLYSLIFDAALGANW